jgi:hypothetical protein
LVSIASTSNQVKAFFLRRENLNISSNFLGTKLYRKMEQMSSESTVLWVVCVLSKKK